MAIQKSTLERRKFIKRAFGIGTVLWLTPAILTVTANESNAQYSGRQVQPRPGGDFINSRSRRLPRRPRVRR